MKHACLVFLLLFFAYGNPCHAQEKKSNPLDAEGLALLHNSDYAGALKLFTKAVKADDKDWQAWYNRGICNYLMDKMTDACLDWRPPAMANDTGSLAMIYKYCDSVVVQPDLSNPTYKVYSFVPHMPEYPGGEMYMNSFIKTTFAYPHAARENGAQGTVMVQFIINEQGTVTSARVVSGVSRECNEEALHIITLMPRWIPGTVNGSPVKVAMTLPILFSLH